MAEIKSELDELADIINKNRISPVDYPVLRNEINFAAFDLITVFIITNNPLEHEYLETAYNILSDPSGNSFIYLARVPYSEYDEFFEEIAGTVEKAEANGILELFPVLQLD